jgi:retron-type reverse transcriptase
VLFDSLDHDLVVKAVEANTGQKWVLLYVKRWLKAPLQMPDGTLRERGRGTPQGSLCSAEHKDPNEQCRIMRSAGLPGLLEAGLTGERCA